MASIAPEIILSLGNVPVTNVLFTSAIVTAVIIVLAVATYRTRALLPTGFYNAMEAFGEALLHQMDGITQDREKSERYFPVILSIFCFVFLNNLVGQMPGIGTIGFDGGHHGELIPLLRPSTSDVNTTVAVAAITVLFSHVVGLRGGVVDHVSKFVNIRGIFRAFRKGPMAVGVAFVEFFVGIIETVGEFAKVLSLSLRLFGNIFAGEILIGVIFSLAKFVVPVPFLFLELFVSLVQASVFALLALTYITVTGSSHTHEENEHEPSSSAQTIPSVH